MADESHAGVGAKQSLTSVVVWYPPHSEKIHLNKWIRVTENLDL